MHLNRAYIGIISLLIFCVSCNSSVVYEKNISIDNAEWSKDKIQNFTFNVPDTTHAYSIEVQITNNDSYQYSNIFLFSNIVFPNKKYIRDTIEFIVSDNTGAWTGKGWRKFTNTYILKSGIRFPQTGKYTFAFEQAMRCTNQDCKLDGIEEISMRIIKK